MDIIISGAIANFGGLSNESFVKYLAAKSSDFEFYQLKPKIGTISAAALDWRAIGNVSAVLGIVSFIWTAYIELIKPEKNVDSNSGIVIKIEHAGSQNQFWVGNNINSKEELIDQVEQILKQSAIDSVEIKNRLKLLEHQIIGKG